jgi:hypothetical protein
MPLQVCKDIRIIRRFATALAGCKDLRIIRMFANGLSGLQNDVLHLLSANCPQI